MVNRYDNNQEPHDVEITSDDTDRAVEDIPELADEEAQGQDKIKALRSELKQSQEEKHRIHEQLQRERADFLNAKKRLEEQKRLDVERVTTAHCEELLPLCDSFEMAMRTDTWTSADPKWRAGIEGIYGQLRQVLRSYEVTAIEPATGDRFDPLLHEALEDSGTNDRIKAVLQKGYRRGERVIRPAKVAVGTSD